MVVCRTLVVLASLALICLPTAGALSTDEAAALRWLDHVAGSLPPDAEKDWWHIGGTQHGLFAML